MVRRALTPLRRLCSSHLTNDAQLTHLKAKYRKRLRFAGVTLSGEAFILYNMSHFLFTCREFSVVRTDEDNAYHNLVIFGQKLRVERTRNVELFSYLPGGLFDLKVKQLEIVLKTKYGMLNPPIHKLYGNPLPIPISCDTIIAAIRNLYQKHVEAHVQPRLPKYCNLQQAATFESKHVAARGQSTPS